MQNITFESLSARIAAIAAAEKITREQLGLLSREVLGYVLESEDVRPINALLGKTDEGKYVLTLQNRKTAGFYFREFTPFSDNGANIEKGEQIVFIKKKAKVWDKFVAKIENWLEVESNDIWKWAAINIQMEVKPKEYASKITKLIEKSLKDEVNGISKIDVMLAVMAAGIEVDDLLALIKEPVAA